jgi:hypothetical protein
VFPRLRAEGLAEVHPKTLAARLLGMKDSCTSNPIVPRSGPSTPAFFETFQQGLQSELEAPLCIVRAGQVPGERDRDRILLFRKRLELPAHLSEIPTLTRIMRLPGVGEPTSPQP